MKYLLFSFIALTACTAGIEKVKYAATTPTPTPTPTYTCSYFSQYDTLDSCHSATSANCNSSWQTFPSGGLSLCYAPVTGYEACAVTPATWDWQYTPWSSWTSSNAGATFERTRSLIKCSSDTCFCSAAVVTTDSCTDLASCTAKTPVTPLALPVYQFMYGSSHFYTLTQAEGSTMPNSGIGFYAYYFQLTGMVPIYRCFISAGTDHFVSTDSACELVPGVVNEGLYGYVYSAPTTGTVALRRYYNPASTDHLSTTDASDGAGYSTYDGIQGYVPDPDTM